MRSPLVFVVLDLDNSPLQVSPGLKLARANFVPGYYSRRAG